MRRWLAMAALALPLTDKIATAAQPTRAKDYAVFGLSDVTLDSYSTVLGPVYSGASTVAKFGYGIQEPSQNAGDFYSRGSFTLESLSEVKGNIFANQNVTLQGSADVTGNIVYGNFYSASTSSDVSGSVTKQTDSVAAVSLPPPTSFTPGFFDAIHTSDFTLAPGAYGAVQQNGLFNEVHLSSGVYTMRSLALNGSTSLHLNFDGMNPIKVYVEDDIFIDSGFDVYVNGAARQRQRRRADGLRGSHAVRNSRQLHHRQRLFELLLRNHLRPRRQRHDGRRGHVRLDPRRGPHHGKRLHRAPPEPVLGAVGPIPGDFTGDFAVDELDLQRWRSGFGLTSASVSQGDANGDQIVNGADFLVWQQISA